MDQKEVIMDQTTAAETIITPIPTITDPVPSSNLKQAAVEALKTFFRYGILGGIMVALGVIIKGINIDTGVISISWSIVEAGFLLTAATALSAALDTFIHKWDALPNATGILGF